MVAKLKPCPFCGGKAVYRVGGADFTPHGYSAACDFGHAQSPDMDTKDEAAIWWNRRADPRIAALEAQLAENGESEDRGQWLFWRRKYGRKSQQASDQKNQIASLLKKVERTEAQLAEVTKEREDALTELGLVIMACPQGERSMPIHKTVSAMRKRLSALETPRPTPAGRPVTVTYKNWRGEVSERTITPSRVWFGSTDWHPEPQWLLTAFDAEKHADRDFALKDFGAVPPAPKVTEEMVEDAKAELFKRGIVDTFSVRAALTAALSGDAS